MTSQIFCNTVDAICFRQKSDSGREQFIFRIHDVKQQQPVDDVTAKLVVATQQRRRVLLLGVNHLVGFASKHPVGLFMGGIDQINSANNLYLKLSVANMLKSCALFTRT